MVFSVGGTCVATRSLSQLQTTIRSSNDDVTHLSRRHSFQPDFTSASVTGDLVSDNVVLLPHGFDANMVQQCMEFRVDCNDAQTVRRGIGNLIEKFLTQADLNQFLRMNGILPFEPFADMLVQMQGFIKSKEELQGVDIDYQTSSPSHWMNKLFYNMKSYGVVRSRTLRIEKAKYEKLSVHQLKALRAVVSITGTTSQERTKQWREIGCSSKPDLIKFITENLDSVLNSNFDIGSIVSTPIGTSKNAAKEAYLKSVPSCSDPIQTNTCHMVTVPATPNPRSNPCVSISCNDFTCCSAPTLNADSTNSVSVGDDTPSAASMLCFCHYVILQS